MSEPTISQVQIKDVEFGERVEIVEPVNLYGCKIGDATRIGPFVEIQKGVKIGKNCRIQSHSFLCTKVTLKDNIFVAHGVIFINDKYPVNREPDKWEETLVEDNVVIGSNATILPVHIGKNSIIGAGSVVTKNVPENSIVMGNPAKIIPSKK